MSSRITRATMIPSKIGAKVKRFYSLSSSGMTHAQSAWNTFMRFAREEFAPEFKRINREIPVGVHRNTLYSLVREHYEPQYKTYLELYDESRPEDGVEWWKSTVRLMGSIRFSPTDYINKQKHLVALGGGAGTGAGTDPAERIPSGFFLAEGLDMVEDDDVVMGGTGAMETTHEMILGGVRYEITTEQMHSIYSVLAGGTASPLTASPLTVSPFPLAPPSASPFTSAFAFAPPSASRVVNIDDDDDDDL
jgi:hypothetical protein